ncbi:unnamed protein product [Adineta ricciae]|uniref:G-protein coupled receptors family 1 profile domain-containing protein n=1 Tax=Adineta ricciae TaxID=249248 RepID=A0A814M050_ADIRI|nr:unnamed protein product [Adineta ricciae]CAF1072049.1 unnamed protein product [Adineta ricciae]
MLNITTLSLMLHQQWSIDKFLRIFILSVIICLTVIGNLYIVLLLSFRRRRTRLHLFILNLAFGDLAICCCTMTSELFLLIYDQEWILGNIACKLTLYIQVVTIASTTFINVAMTYDRYEAICCPLRILATFGRIYRTILLCWIASFIIAIPQLFIFEQSLSLTSPTKYRCASTGYTAEWQRRVYFAIFALYVLILPVICMTYWYIRIIRTVNASSKVWTKSLRAQSPPTTYILSPSSKKVRTVKLALTIIIAFVVCWTPYMVLTLIEIYSNGRFRIPSWCDGVLQTICLVQSSFNPFIYLGFNQRKRSSITLILAAASTHSQRSKIKIHGKLRQRGGSISLDSWTKPFSRNNTLNSLKIDHDQSSSSRNQNYD